MALASSTPSTGGFTEKTHGNRFDFRNIEAGDFNPFDMPHEIFVGFDQKRYARVLKTVAYVVVDEGVDGAPIFEKWNIRNHFLVADFS